MLTRMTRRWGRTSPSCSERATRRAWSTTGTRRGCSRAVWLRLLTEAGFLPEIVVDLYGREVFVARKPGGGAASDEDPNVLLKGAKKCLG